MSTFHRTPLQNVQNFPLSAFSTVCSGAAAAVSFLNKEQGHLSWWHIDNCHTVILSAGQQRSRSTTENRWNSSGFCDISTTKGYSDDIKQSQRLWLAIWGLWPFVPWFLYITMTSFTRLVICWMYFRKTTRLFHPGLLRVLFVKKKSLLRLPLNTFYVLSIKGNRVFICETFSALENSLFGSNKPKR